MFGFFDVGSNHFVGRIVCTVLHRLHVGKELIVGG